MRSRATSLPFRSLSRLTGGSNVNHFMSGNYRERGRGPGRGACRLTKQAPRGNVRPCGRLAQLVRAPGLHPGCRGFKSLSAQTKPRSASGRSGFRTWKALRDLKGRRAERQRGERARMASASADPGPEAQGRMPRAGGQSLSAHWKRPVSLRLPGRFYLGGAAGFEPNMPVRAPARTSRQDVGERHRGKRARIRSENLGIPCVSGPHGLHGLVQKDETVRIAPKIRMVPLAQSSVIP